MFDRLMSGDLHPQWLDAGIWFLARHWSQAAALRVMKPIH